MSQQGLNQDNAVNSSDLWDNRELGASEDHAVKSDRDATLADDKLDLQMISIRLQKGLIEDLKNIAEIQGLGYQPLMKRVLKRFVDAEHKQMLNQQIAEQRRLKSECAKSEEQSGEAFQEDTRLAS